MLYLAWLWAAQVAAGTWPNEKTAVNAVKKIAFHILGAYQKKSAGPRKKRNGSDEWLAASRSERRTVADLARSAEGLNLPVPHASFTPSTPNQEFGK
jgi:hypothetical protein